MSILCSCVYCRKEYSIKGIHTHIDRTHMKSTKYSSGNNGKYHIQSINAQLKRNKLEEEYDINPNHCINCKCVLSYKNRKNKFCSNKCSAKFNNKAHGSKSLECRAKISESLTGRKYIPPSEITGQCKECKSNFTYTLKLRHRTFCSRSCATKYSSRNRYAQNRENRSALTNYRADCQFRFNLADFKDEFDFTLIEQYGWYKAKNRGNNLIGVSRDHIVSVRYGFDNNISPKIISHPANCQLMQHGKNVSKGRGCHMTLEELLAKIDIWNNKYSNNGECVWDTTGACTSG